MRKIINVIGLCFLISGCDSEKKKAPEERITARIEKRNNLAFVPQETTPFTGEFQGYYRNGYKKAEIHFKDGKQHGVAKMWYENGQQSNEATFYNGKLEGMATEWFSNGEKNKDRIFRDGKLTGSVD
jgi:antitoxin component YwqK of YwqJK toxin-antitoxin module